MEKSEELSLFLAKADELLDSKYVLADVKIANMLKVIASSESLLALFKSCLDGFDYEEAKKKYLVKAPYLADDKGEFILPESTKDLLALIFCLLVDIDAKHIILNEFLSRFFYEDGSSYAGYSAFLNGVVKPFKTAVSYIMESVIEGKMQDPVDAVIKEEERQAVEREENLKKKVEEERLSKLACGEKIKKLRSIFLVDKKKVKDSKLKESEKDDMTLVIDTLATLVESGDKDSINYALITYYYMAKNHPILFFNRAKTVKNLVTGVVNGI